MVMSGCKFLSNLLFKSHSIVIRMVDTLFLATWDDIDNVGFFILTKAELKDFTTSTGSDKGKRFTPMLKKHFFHWHSTYFQKSDEKY